MKEITDFLISKSVSLKNIGINDVALKYKDIKELLKMLRIYNLTILGGDVLNSDLEYTYDNWYIEKETLDPSKFSSFSIDITEKYIENYVNLNGDNFYFVLVFEKNLI